MKLHRWLFLTVLVVSMLVSSIALAQDAVIGKVYLKAGAEVFVLTPAGGGTYIPFSGTAFEDQEFYILELIENDKGKGYKVDGNGFVHNCPTHGKETFNENILILVLEQQVDGINIRVELF